MKTLPLLLASASVLLAVVADASAQSRWLHVRGQEQTSSRASIAVNLPLRPAMAITRTIARRGDTHFEFAGHRVRIDSLTTGWSSLRERNPGEQITLQKPDYDVLFVRTAAGMRMTTSDRWSGESAELEAAAPLLDAFANGALFESEVATALASVPSNVPLLTSRDGESSVVVWVDDRPEGRLP